LALGDQVQVMPVDYGFDPVKGELVHCSPEEIAVRRSDPRAGTVVVHFPALRISGEQGSPEALASTGLPLRRRS
jgi:hypothetical protein